MSDSNVTDLPTSVSKLRAQIDQIRRDLPVMLEYYAIDAEIKWKRFHILRKQGFTPEQALELIKGP